MRRLLLALALVATACSAPAAPPTSSSAQDKALSWTPCHEGLECASLTVPLDYDQPGGQKIKISVAKRPATGEPIGSLLINPGGPGGSGIEYVQDSPVSETLLERFDLIGFDPRGVGESTPIRCLSEPDLDSYLSLDMTPDTPEEKAAIVAGAKEFAAGCEKNAGSLLAHVGTADAARDMDVLREALGDSKLTYLGKSYGTYLGAVYAQLFPDRVRALVLDGAVDPRVSALDLNEVQAKGFEVAMRAFVEDCFTVADCPFSSRNVEGALDEISRLLQRSDLLPLRNQADSRVINDTWAAFGVITPLYDKGAWEVLRGALRDAFAGDGSQLLRMADVLLGRRMDGSWSNQTEANKAVNCLDHAFPTDVAAYEAAARGAAEVAPRFGAFVMWDSLACAYWPARSSEADLRITAAGAAPILVVGTTRDPATPYEWAEGLAAQLESGVLLSYDGDGHTAYGTGSPCVDKAVDAYLVDLAVPAEGTRC
ncbi:alpha/beta hydrolase [Herbidospora mongoliensis]|uniref:alpha/beta hydrolase n=1 Tax=Herbidospora mongoliensis TaxID=688067 RepID=UPI000AA75AD3|nr:alpha/beta hydrolase [Herbidospora mongoliensis]